jgi:hypothetical protein
VRRGALAVLFLLGCGRLRFDDRVDATQTAAVALAQDDANELYMGATDASASFSAPVSRGSLVWVSIVTYGTNAISSVTDDQGNIYALAFDVIGSGCSTPAVWGYYARDVAGGPLTMTAHGGRTWGIHLREYTGSPSFVMQNTATGAGGIADSGPVMIPSSSSLAIAVQTHCQMLTTSAGSGWTHHVVTTENQMYQAMSTEDLIDAQPGTYDGTFTYSPIEGLGWAAGCAVFSG